MDDENILKIKTKRLKDDKQKPIVQSVEAARKWVVDKMAKKD